MQSSFEFTSKVRVELAEGSCDSPAPTGEKQMMSASEKPRARILVIDDEPLLGQTLRLAFQDRHDVVTVTSGREALELLQRDAGFDLVLCDLMMPDLSGMTLYQEIANEHSELAKKFVFMTGGAFTDSAREFLEVHPGIHLEKPFKIEDVEALITP